MAREAFDRMEESLAEALATAENESTRFHIRQAAQHLEVTRWKHAAEAEP